MVHYIEGSPDQTLQYQEGPKLSVVRMRCHARVYNSEMYLYDRGHNVPTNAVGREWV